MIGCLKGKILEINDGKVLLLTANGIGYELFFNQENKISLDVDSTLFYTTNIIKETSSELYGFLTSYEKKIFELLISVKGVGPKSAFSMINSIGPRDIVQAIIMDNKKVLSSAPGIGNKAASQIVLDLSSKISKFCDGQLFKNHSELLNAKNVNEQQMSLGSINNKFMDETLMACKELGFKESEILSLAQNILNKTEITSSEQLIHQVLKEL